MVVVLGNTGRNFAAGMSGGIAYILDENANFSNSCNLDMVGLENIVDQKDKITLKNLLEDHLKYTHSANARRILEQWEDMLPKFVKEMPNDYRRLLEEQDSANPGSKKVYSG